MFKITTNGKTVLMTVYQLSETLVAKSISPKVSEKTQTAIPALAKALAERLESQGLLKETTPQSLIALGIGVGYYLNTFFRKNEVEIETQDASERLSDQST